MNDDRASAFRILRLAAAGVVFALLTGCASMMGPNPRDPLEPFNRKMAEFNEHVDSIVLKPVATAYRNGVPPAGRTAVSNFFGNLQDAWSAVNSVLQLRLQDAGESWARFQINSTVGFFGIYDAASLLNIDKHKEDFGQTLGRWGVPAGPFIVLPVLGPSTLRDAAVFPIELYGDLVWHMPRGDERSLLSGLRAVDRRANLLRASDVLDQASLDKYSFTREAYLQRRRADVMDFRNSNGGGALGSKLGIGIGKDSDPKDGKDNDGAEPPEPDAAPAKPAGQPAPAPAR
ncbi:MlaA family lipoprotein [Ramlibacter sp. PS4R-6]|uniref:MlaA family lipoprotein n=1 Tax=Ramlibacter sp. PS4R-6 TaxID=3133438 RepID=UPI003097B9C9